MLSVKPSGAKSWVQSIVIRSRRRTFGLGPYPLISLKEARETAAENRRIARAGGDPLAERRRRRTVPTFAEVAREVIDFKSKGWRAGGKSRAQWESTLSHYAYPLLGDLRVDAVTSADILQVLRPIWHKKRETASRVHQRISAVMRTAIVEGYRPDDPAGPQLKDVLDRKRPPVTHHRSLPYEDAADAIARVRASQAGVTTKLCFEFLVLTAARSGEARGAVWSEILWEDREWLIPGTRMKAKEPHQVPLADRTLEILQEAQEISAGYGTELIFPSPRGKVLSDSTLSKLLRELGIPAVPHGFRATFNTWGSEVLGERDDVLDKALAHTIRDPVKRAYKRVRYDVDRCRVLNDWASYLAGNPEWTPTPRMNPASARQSDGGRGQTSAR